jgi:hypothetical protein
MFKLLVRPVFFLLLFAVPATAGVIVDNFPILGSAYALSILGGQSVSNSFALGSETVVDGVNFGVWLEPGDSLSQVNWAIGSAPFGTDFGTGSSPVTTQYLFTNSYPGHSYEIDLAHFSFGGVDLPAAVYYLTLSNAVVSNGPQAYWDVNFRPGVDTWLRNPDPIHYAGNAGSYQILTSVPEPSTLALAILGGILAAFASWRKYSL